MSEAHRYHFPLHDPTNGPVRFRPRGPQPEVKIATSNREAGELNLAKLAAAASIELSRIEAKRQAMQPIEPLPVLTIVKPELRALVLQARHELARLNASKRADHRREAEG
ncbi:MAG: hypothetical protein EOP83_09680 [Verrucomicrobiaceae bacterium]|nr:MAG: hypothetical protein EOP83_09680 [Verrucomicrobiaceae bacterium]